MAMNDDPAVRRSGGAGPLVLLLIVGAAGYGGWVYLKGLPTGDVAPAAAAAATPDPGARASTFATSPADAAKSGQAKAAAQPASQPQAGRAASSRVGPTASTAATAATAAPPSSGSSPQPGVSSPGSAAASAEPERSAPSSGPPALTPSSEIFDTASAGVKSPVLITPGANTPLLTGLRHPPGTPGIEIIINTDGFVGSVKAVTKPTSLAESLEYHNGLSVAKSWQFQPALRDGQPVRFRIFMPLSTLRTKSAVK